MLQGVMSADRVRTAYFLADLKTEKGWVEVHDDAMNPEDIEVGRWVDVGPFKIFDTWMSFPAGAPHQRRRLERSASQGRLRYSQLQD